jgi:UDP-N-acetylmuramoyl-L-alanyl-D-glutamate--2,6-diaminopimelate ligase
VTPASSAGQLPRPTGVRPVALSALVPREPRPDGSDAVHYLAADARDVEVTGITAASGNVRPGDLFAGLPGSAIHGAELVETARAAGAVAVVTDAVGASFVPADVPVLVVDDVRRRLGPIAATVYGQPSRALTMLGITGTSGKTTTAYLARSGLTAAGVPTALIGTVATLIGDDELATGFTTPEAPELQALLALMVERGSRTVVMEVSSHALSMERVTGIEFAVGAFTNLSQDHLDFHADMEQYFAAKARLFDGRTAVPIIVTDDSWGRRLATELTERRAEYAPVTVSTTGDSSVTWRAADIRTGPDGRTRFQVLGPGTRFEAGCAVPGEYNVANVLVALALVDNAGVPAAQAAAAISVATVPGRMERIDAGQPFLAVVDYSHKPAAVEGALRALRPLTRGRLIVVLGCGGDRDRAKRPVMGEVAARDGDLVIITDDNPRSEPPAAIRAAMLAGARAVPTGRRAEIREIGDRGEAIQAAVALAGPGDTVLLAGKGHETGQEIAGRVYPFDDRDVLRRALEGLAS